MQDWANKHRVAPAASSSAEPAVRHDDAAVAAPSAPGADQPSTSADEDEVIVL